MAPIEALQFSPAVPNSSNEKMVEAYNNSIDATRGGHPTKNVKQADNDVTVDLGDVPYGGTRVDQNVINDHSLHFSRRDIYRMMYTIMAYRDTPNDSMAWENEMSWQDMLFFPAEALDPRQKVLRRQLLYHPTLFYRMGGEAVPPELQDPPPLGFDVTLQKQVPTATQQNQVEPTEQQSAPQRFQIQQTEPIRVPFANILASDSPAETTTPTNRPERAPSNTTNAADTSAAPRRRADLVNNDRTNRLTNNNQAINRPTPFALAPASFGRQQFAVDQLETQYAENNQLRSLYLLAFLSSLEPHAMATRLYQHAIYTMGALPAISRPKYTRQEPHVRGYQPKVQPVHFKMEI